MKKTRPTFHYADIKNSPRLQAILIFLSDAKWHSTWDIIRKTKTVCASAGISELRHNGYDIRSRSVWLKKKVVWSYKYFPLAYDLKNNLLFPEKKV